jgi:hypothetical protein
MASMEWLRGNHSRSLQLAQEMHRISRAWGNIRGELDGIRLQAQCHLLRGDFNRCLQLVDEGKELVVRASVKGAQMEGMLMSIEAIAYDLKTEYSNARRVHDIILHQTSALLSPLEHATALVNIGFLDIVTGASAHAIASCNLKAALTVFQNVRHPRGISYYELYHADLLLREGDAMGARVEYIRLFDAIGNNDHHLACDCLAKLADPTNPVHDDTDSARWAVIFLTFALRPLVRTQRNPLMVHRGLRRLGDVLVRQGADNTALSVLAVALDGFTRMDVHQSRAECMRTILRRRLYTPWRSSQGSRKLGGSTTVV